MALKINSNNFYLNHCNEIDRYLNSELRSLHLVNETSDIIENINVNRTLTVKFNNIDNIKKLSESKEYYDLIVLTDLFEISDDIYNFLLEIKKLLTRKNFNYIN